MPTKLRQPQNDTDSDKPNAKTTKSTHQLAKALLHHADSLSEKLT